jgi:hypothetical protein
MKKSIPRFSFIESLTKENRDPHQSQHFQQIFDDIRQLEQWMKEKKVKNHWDLTEKLAFLRNVESAIRTGTAVRRTQLAWLTLTIGTIAALTGVLLSI